jgi:hypothetical protein
MNNTQFQLPGNKATYIHPQIRSFQESRREASSYTRQPAKVIPFHHTGKPSLLNDKKSYLLLHIAIGIALGVSLVMTLVSFMTQFWIQRSVISLLVTLTVYAAVTYYYHCMRKKKTRLFGRGLLIVALSAAPMLFLFLL